jgi:hypothetical protein
LLAIALQDVPATDVCFIQVSPFVPSTHIFADTPIIPSIVLSYEILNGTVALIKPDVGETVPKSVEPVNDVIEIDGSGFVFNATAFVFVAGARKVAEDQIIVPKNARQNIAIGEMASI